MCEKPGQPRLVDLRLVGGRQLPHSRRTLTPIMRNGERSPQQRLPPLPLLLLPTFANNLPTLLGQAILA